MAFISLMHAFTSNGCQHRYQTLTTYPLLTKQYESGSFKGHRFSRYTHINTDHTDTKAAPEINAPSQVAAKLIAQNV